MCILSLTQSSDTSESEERMCNKGGPRLITYGIIARNKASHTLLRQGYSRRAATQSCNHVNSHHPITFHLVTRINIPDSLASSLLSKAVTCYTSGLTGPSRGWPQRCIEQSWEGRRLCVDTSCPRRLHAATAMDCSGFRCARSSVV